MLQRIALGVFLMVPSFVSAKEADVLLGGTLCFFFTRCEPEAPTSERSEG
jgi:hypothetical protein